MARELEDRAVKPDSMPDLVETLTWAIARPHSASNRPATMLNSSQRVDRRQQHVGVEVQVGVLDAVERVVVVVDALAGDVEREAVALAAHALLALARRGAVGRRARNQRRELQVVASVERQLDDGAVLDDGADRGVLGLEQRRAAGDFDRLSEQLPDFERERRSGWRCLPEPRCSCAPAS